MKRIVNSLMLAAAMLAALSCSKTTANHMLQLADKVKVESTPAVLQLAGSTIPVEVAVTYPKGWFHPDAMLVVTPVLVYEGGQQTGESKIYQGENVKENNRVVPAAGGTVREKMSFDYVKGMEKSYLELHNVAVIGGKRVELPTVKVADGLNTTVQLADALGAYDYKADAYQEVVKQSAEGQILYDVNSATVKQGELNSSSIRDFKQALKEMQASDRVTVKGTRIISYASPEGGEELNAKLSDERSDAARKAWSTISKGMDASAPEVQSVGQDWEGFQEAVAKSNILDKELILRVLSMYSDPAVRESEIKNMSQIYTEIKDEVFPELRRSRFVTDIEYKNYSEDDLRKLAGKRLYMLDEEALLRLASITEDPSRKALLYRAAAEKYNSARAFYNLGLVSLDENKPAVTEAYLDKLEEESDPDVLNTRGVIALRRGDYAKAEELFNKSGNATAKGNLGTVSLLKGDYAEAVKRLAGAGSFNEALALVLDNQPEKASKVLEGLSGAKADYLRAIVAARTGKRSEMKSALDAACAADPALKERSIRDIEFSVFAN